MAKNNNIRLPDGTTVSVPAWASENTLKALLGQLKVGSRFYKSLTDLIARGDYDASKLSQAIQKNSKAQQDSDNRENKAEKRSRENFAKTIAKATNDIVGEFSNTDKPLTTLTKNLEQLTSGVANATGSMLGKSKTLMKMAGPYMETAGKVGGAMTDALFAYAGFQAGRVEQFAKAQENMINAGAIFHDASFDFHSLYKKSVQGGISYQKFTELVQQHGVGMQILGDGVSTGSKTFIEFFKNINKAGDQFGDWGLSNENMAEVYADYINVARLTGTITRGMTDVMDKSKVGFTELMNETSALSSLTGQSRDKIIRDRFSALSDPAAAAGILQLRDAGMHKQADAAEAVLSQIALAGDALGQPGVELANAINKTLQMKSDDIKNFDIQDVLNQTSPELIGAFNQMAPGFIDSINTAIKTGSTSGNLSTFILDQWSVMKANIDASMQTQLDGPAALIYSIEQGQIALNRDYSNVLGLSATEFAAIVKQSENNLKTSGTAVVALNDMTATYLQAMEWLTWNLDDTSSLAKDFSGMLLEFFDEPGPERDYTDAAAQNAAADRRLIAIAEAQGLANDKNYETQYKELSFEQFRKRTDLQKIGTPWGDAWREGSEHKAVYLYNDHIKEKLRGVSTINENTQSMSSIQPSSTALAAINSSDSSASLSGTVAIMQQQSAALANSYRNLEKVVTVLSSQNTVLA